MQEVFSRLNNEVYGKLAGEYPEVYLVSLLENIKERLPEVSAMLYSTVEMSVFGSSLEEARQRLGLQKTQQTKSQLNHLGKKGKKRTKSPHLEKVSA
ncbi:MAG: hypothetical protein Q8R17_01735 [bacterium]|nr:hypothetical protein [bacterium]